MSRRASSDDLPPTTTNTQRDHHAPTLIQHIRTLYRTTNHHQDVLTMLGIDHLT